MAGTAGVAGIAGVARVAIGFEDSVGALRGGVGVEVLRINCGLELGVVTGRIVSEARGSWWFA